MRGCQGHRPWGRGGCGAGQCWTQHHFGWWVPGTPQFWPLRWFRAEPEALCPLAHPMSVQCQQHIPASAAPGPCGSRCPDAGCACLPDLAGLCLAGPGSGRCMSIQHPACRWLSHAGHVRHQVHHHGGTSQCWSIPISAAARPHSIWRALAVAMPWGCIPPTWCQCSHWRSWAKEGGKLRQVGGGGQGQSGVAVCVGEGVPLRPGTATQGTWEGWQCRGRYPQPWACVPPTHIPPPCSRDPPPLPGLELVLVLYGEKKAPTRVPLGGGQVPVGSGGSLGGCAPPRADWTQMLGGCWHPGPTQPCLDWDGWRRSRSVLEGGVHPS